MDASCANQAIIERIMAALKKHDIDEDDIQTSNYSIWPRQQHDPRQSDEVTITGYHASNMVTVVVQDIITSARLSERVSSMPVRTRCTASILR
ncbi:MAG: SIMPL domain-containing protein [Woeseiaceae bacterium]|nr:SIMPL domain-containing protein [Woeseiaceae bacterium]